MKDMLAGCSLAASFAVVIPLPVAVNRSCPRNYQSTRWELESAVAVAAGRDCSFDLESTAVHIVVEMNYVHSG